MSRHIHRFIFRSVSIYYQPIISIERLYGRWMHRQPTKVLLPFESTIKANLKKEKVIELDSEVLKKPQSKNAKALQREGYAEINEVTKSRLPIEQTMKIKEKRDEKLKRRKFYISQAKVFDENDEVIYEKLKENDSQISNLLVKLKSKKERIRFGHTLVEGWRLIVDGLEAKCTLKYVIFSKVEELNNLRPFLPKTGVKFYKIPYKEIELWSDVQTSPGIFGIFETPTAENVKRLSRPLPIQFICDNVRIPGNLGAILRVAVGVGCEKVLLTKGCVDVWDPKVIRSAAGAHFRLHVHHSIDWEEMPKLLAEDTSIFIADSNAKVEDEISTTDGSFLKIPVLPYYGVEYSSLRHITLIIGGETEGISQHSYNLASKKNGLRLNVHLDRGVDSLNTGMATAVIAFEMKKQIITSWAKAKLERQMGHVA